VKAAYLFAGIVVVIGFIAGSESVGDRSDCSLRRGGRVLSGLIVAGSA